jgi:acetyltransferase-like isoleucine patch superfamily enzyme
VTAAQPSAPALRSARARPVLLPSLGGAVRRAESAVVAAVLRRRGVVLGRGARFLGRPVVSVTDGSTVVIGHRFIAASRSTLTALGVSHPTVIRTLRPGAVVEIGDDVGISGGSVCAALRVSIGAGCLLGADVTIADTDFHPLDHLSRRYAPPPAPRPEDAVSIGRNVFIGTGAIILRGSRIGDDAVVGAGAVVRGRVESGTVVAGNPARPLRRLAVPYLPPVLG